MESLKIFMYSETSTENPKTILGFQMYVQIYILY